MKQEKVVNLGIVYNAFDPTDVTKGELVYRKNARLKTYLEDLPTDCEWKIGLNGELVELERDGNMRLKPNDKITLVVVPRGGDGFKDILRLVAMVALAVAASIIIAQVGGILGVALAAVAVIGGTLLINAVLPPKVPKNDKDSEDVSYGYDGAKNTIKEGVSIPVVYGEYRVGGNYINVYSENVGDDQYLFGRTVLSDGTVEAVTDPMLNDQPISNYLNVDWGVTLGNYTDDVVPYFNRNIAQVTKSVKLQGAGDWVTHTSTSKVDAVQFNIQFSRGLVHVDSKGKKQSRTATVEIQMTERGTQNWRALGSSVFTNVPGNATTPETTKLSVTVEPNVTAAQTVANLPYQYEIQYKKTDATEWTTFRKVSDFTRGTNSVGTGIVGDAQFYAASTGSTYEWAVPQGAYDIRVVGQGTIVSHGYLQAQAGGQSTYSFTDNRVKVLRRTIESGELANDFYDFRIRKTSPEGDGENDLDEIYLVDIGEVNSDVIAVNTLSTGYYRIKANEQLQSIPTITWLVKGVKVNKYDLDGNVTVKEWSNNPAWIVLDMLIGEERGTPGIYTIDFPAFLEWAEWCEFAGLKFNAVFDTTQTLWDALVDVLKCGHAAFSRIGTKLSLAIDKPQQPVMLFGPGNMFKDTFKITYVPLTGRANEFELSYYDREDGNKQKTIRTVDPEADQRGDIPRPVQFAVLGVDNYEQAQQEMWYQLYNNRYIRRSVTFDAPVESIGLGIGDVALIQHDMMNWGKAGRIDVASTATVVNLDKLVSMEDGNVYMLMVKHDVVEKASGVLTGVVASTAVVTVTGDKDGLAAGKRLYQASTGCDRQINDISVDGNTVYVEFDGTNGFTNGPVAIIDTDVLEEREVIFVPGESDTVTVKTPFSKAPAQYVNYMFGIKNAMKKPYRLKGMSGQDFDRRTLTFIEYNEGIYAAPEMLVPQPTAAPSKAAQHVKGVVYNYSLRATEGNTNIGGVLSWNTDSKDYGGADIYVGLNDGDPVFNKTVLNATECQLDFFLGDGATVKVVAFNENGTRAPNGTAPVISVVIQATGAYIAPVTNLVASQDSYVASALVNVSWTKPVAASTLYSYRVQVQRKQTGPWDDYGTTVESTTKVGDIPEGTHNIRVRAEVGAAYSIWKTTTVNTYKTSDTVEPGAGGGGSSNDDAFKQGYI